MPNSKCLATEMSILENLIQDLKLAYPPLEKELALDLRKMKTRIMSEGLPFITQKLPSMAKAVLQGFRTHVFVNPEGFAYKRGTKLPMLMHGLLREVFDELGNERENADPGIVRDLLQVFGLFYKCEYPYTQSQKDSVIQAFLATERDLECLQIPFTATLDAAAVIAEDVFKSFDPMDVEPQHGPGSVATREVLEEKWEFKRKYESIHRVYPYYEYFVPSRSHLLTPEALKWYRSLATEELGVAKVALVNKDARGPRLISLEPLEFQFIQQGLQKSLRSHIEAHTLTRGLVNFKDQGVNRDLASKHSITNDYATLDMKEASDRVSVALIERLFHRLPKLLNSLLAVRTEATLLPDNRIVPMRKYAPMGSATCFPVEAITFWLLAEAIRRREKIPGRVFVYGDDIIVPKDLAKHLFAEFPKYGLKFNEDKCFIEGFFRESCGMDAYKGVQVAPIRMRKPWPRDLKDASSVAASVALCNHFYTGGFWSTARFLESLCHRLVPCLAYSKIGDSERFALKRCTDGPVFGVDSKARASHKRKFRYNAGLFRMEVKVSMPVSSASVRVPSLWDLPVNEREVDLPFAKGTGKLFAGLLEKQCDKYVSKNASGSIHERWQPLELYLDHSVIHNTPERGRAQWWRRGLVPASAKWTVHPYRPH